MKPTSEEAKERAVVISLFAKMITNPDTTMCQHWEKFAITCPADKIFVAALTWAAMTHDTLERMSSLDPIHKALAETTGIDKTHLPRFRNYGQEIKLNAIDFLEHLAEKFPESDEIQKHLRFWAVADIGRPPDNKL